mgnify:CR=1 FL=1
MVILMKAFAPTLPILLDFQAVLRRQLSQRTHEYLPFDRSLALEARPGKLSPQAISNRFKPKVMPRLNANGFIRWAQQCHCMLPGTCQKQTTSYSRMAESRMQRARAVATCPQGKQTVTYKPVPYTLLQLPTTLPLLHFPSLLPSPYTHP